MRPSTFHNHPYPEPDVWNSTCFGFTEPKWPFDFPCWIRWTFCRSNNVHRPITNHIHRPKYLRQARAVQWRCRGMKKIIWKDRSDSFCFLTSLWMNDGTNIYFGYYCLFSGIVMDDAYCLLIVLTVGHFIVWLAFYTLYIPTQPRVLPSSFSHLECAWYSVSGLRPTVLMLWRDLILIVHGLTILGPSSKTLFTPIQFNWT